MKGILRNNRKMPFFSSIRDFSRVLQLAKNKIALHTPKMRVKRTLISFEKSISTDA